MGIRRRGSIPNWSDTGLTGVIRMYPTAPGLTSGRPQASPRPGKSQGFFNSWQGFFLGRIHLSTGQDARILKNPEFSKKWIFKKARSARIFYSYLNFYSLFLFLFLFLFSFVIFILYFYFSFYFTSFYFYLWFWFFII